jgi:NAD(P)-dependent dehydrogenase (short-subunit alcohol dehydrogenase family)
MGMRILLTGADGALGTIVRQILAQAGHEVLGLAGGLQADQPDQGLLAAGDLADPLAARAVVDRAAARLDRFDAVVHLVGGFKWTTIESSSLADWKAMFSGNVETAVATIQAALPHLGERASIVLVGANAAQPAGAGFGPYGAAKSAVARLTEALASELQPRGARANAILPAIIDTPANRRDMPDADPSSWTSPEAIAEVILFLVGPQSRAITGALIPVTNAA